MGRKYSGDRAWHSFHKGHWCIAYCVYDRDRGGPWTRRIRLPAGTTAAAAAAAAEEFHRELTSRGLDAPHDWKSAERRFIEHRRAEGDKENGLAVYGQRLTAVGKLLGFPDPWSLTTQRGREWLVQRLAMPGARKGTTISPVTARAELSAMVEFMRFLVAGGWMKEVTWASVKPPKGKGHGRGWYRTAEVGPFLRAAVKLRDRWPEWPSLAGVALSSALRPGELLALVIRDVDALHGTVLVEHGKSDESETAIPIQSDEALEELRAWLEVRRTQGAQTTDLVWPLGRRRRRNWNRPAFREKSRDEKPLRMRIRVTAKLAGVPYIPPYGLRHTALTLAGQSVDAEDLARLARHRDSRTTTSTYRHVLPGSRRRAARVLGSITDRLWRGQSSLRVVGGGNDEGPGAGTSEAFEVPCSNRVPVDSTGTDADAIARN